MDVYSFFRSSRFLSKFKAISVIGCLALSFNTNAQSLIPPHEPDVLLTGAVSGSEANINTDAIQSFSSTAEISEAYVWDATQQQLGIMFSNYTNDVYKTVAQYGFSAQR